MREEGHTSGLHIVGLHIVGVAYKLLRRGIYRFGLSVKLYNLRVRGVISTGRLHTQGGRGKGAGNVAGWDAQSLKGGWDLTLS